MTRLEKCELAKQKGYIYNAETGKVTGLKGLEIKRKDNYGYTILNLGKNLNLKVHHFAWYMTYGNVDFIELDHKNQNPDDNKISNLRILTRAEQTQNRNFKGYSLDKGKWRSQIFFNGKRLYLGIFDTEVEAKNAYLEAKKKYHII